MKLRGWFLPDTPDVLGLLRHQLAVTISAVDGFQAWAAGDGGAAQAVLGTEGEGEAAKREVLRALRAAFVTPLKPEDVFALSRGVDRILNSARDLVKESEAMDCPPDAGIAEMARLLGVALQHIDDAIARLGSDGDEAAASADAAITTERQLQSAYYKGMAGLLESRTGASASRVASSTAAARGSAKPWSRSPSEWSMRS